VEVSGRRDRQERVGRPRSGSGHRGQAGPPATGTGMPEMHTGGELRTVPPTVSYRPRANPQGFAGVGVSPTRPADIGPWPSEAGHPYWEAAPLGDGRRAVRRRRHMTPGQRIGGLLLAVGCAGAAAWYVPSIVAADEHSLTGTVTSTGVVDLNFARAGQIEKIDVHLGQQVNRGETLASEFAPADQAVIRADKAAIAAQRAKLAELKASPGPGQQAAGAAATARLDKNQAQLDTDLANLIGTRIVAAEAGTVVAVNGEPGELVSSLGIRDYSSDSGTAAVGVQPEFSLLPEGPQSSIKATGAQSELPVVALRVSNSWEVVILIPESSISTVKAGEAVTISVPSAGISGLRGVIEEILPSPESTAQGVAYQAVVTVPGDQPRAPLSGMSANVDLDS
jgi:multidrug efflux pump subunit AcrA (membrane-fusion protein)